LRRGQICETKLKFGYYTALEMPAGASRYYPFSLSLRLIILRASFPFYLLMTLPKLSVGSRKEDGVPACVAEVCSEQERSSRPVKPLLLLSLRR
jgi:hypothetical protein